jgi:aldose 1-epimerase
MPDRFGSLADGRVVETVTIGEPHGLQAELLSYGAILRRLTFPVNGVRRDLVLNFDRLRDYERDPAYVGPVVGRFGNRIADGRFTIDGREFRVTPNEGVNHLHGGALGFGRRLWSVVEATRDRTVMAYRSPDGEEGYPGNLDVRIEISVIRASLRLSISARTDAPSPVNVTWHPYFNLAADKRASATAHLLRIPAAHYLPVRAGLIPAGEVAAVAGTPFDFRTLRVLAPPTVGRHPQLALAGGYDHCWVLSVDADCSCELVSPERDLAMTIKGTGPGLQFYNGQFLARAHPRLGGGLILEPQGLPNAPNELRFPDCILRPGAEYRADIEYQFAAVRSA